MENAPRGDNAPAGMTREEYHRAVDACADDVFRFVHRACRSREMAEDVVQDAYARLWELLSSVEAAKARAFLFATAHHRMIDLLRREKRYADVESIEERAGTCSSRHADLQSLLDAALARLPADQRTVVLLRDLEGYAYREIAEMTGLSEVQVKVYIFRARVAMRTYIGAIDHVI